MKKQNKFNRLSKTSAIICLIFCLIVSSIPGIANAKVWSPYTGADALDDNMEMKLYYMAVRSCLLEKKDGALNYHLTTTPYTIANNFFKSNFSVGAGVYIESTGTGDGHDGKIWCRGDGGKDGDIIAGLIDKSGIDFEDFICGFADEEKAGAYISSDSKYTCRYAYENGMKLTKNTSVANTDEDRINYYANYLARVVAKKVYGSDSAENIAKLHTAIGARENWVLNYESFSTGCVGAYVTKDAVTDQDSYINTVEKPTTGAAKPAKSYYVYRSGVSDGTKVILYTYREKYKDFDKNQVSIRCGDLKQSLREGGLVFDNYFKLYKDFNQTEIGSNKENCGNGIHDTIATWENIYNKYEYRYRSGTTTASDLAALWLLAQGVTTETYVAEIDAKVTPNLTRVNQLTVDHVSWGQGTPTDQFYINSIEAAINNASESITVDGNNLKLYDGALIENVKKAASDLYHNTDYIKDVQQKAPDQGIIDAAKEVLVQLKAQNDSVKAAINSFKNYIEQMNYSGSPKQPNYGIPDYAIPSTPDYRSPTVTRSGDGYDPSGNLYYYAGIGATTAADYFGDVYTADEYGYVCKNKYPFRNKPDIIAAAVTVVPYDPQHSSATPDDPGGASYYNSGESSPCIKSAGGLGWIACVVGGAGSSLAKWLYGFVEPWTRVNDSVVSQMSGTMMVKGVKTTSTMFSTWANIRDLANLIFIMLFMVVIFSQLTGFGIDNYGIKKMLPKLVMSAVLINVSFFICAVAIDISNILGKSIQDFLVGLDITGYGKEWGNNPITDTVIDSLLTVMGVGGTVLAFQNIDLLIWPLFMLLIGLVCALFFAFLVLGFRQALIIILVIISPIAFACNILPNTEKLYKRWFDTFKAMLIVYPVVGLLIGGGRLTGEIMSQTMTGDIGLIVAALLETVPYFLVPSLSRKAINQIDGLGGKLQGMGKRLGAFTRGKADNSAFGKAFKMDRAAHNAIRGNKRANYENRAEGKPTKNRFGFGKEKVRGMSTAQWLRYQNNLQTADANMQAELSARSAEAKHNNLVNGGFEAAKIAIKTNEDEAAIKNVTAAIQSGTFRLEGYNGNKPINANDPKDLIAALKAAVKSDHPNTHTITALTNMAISKDDDKARGAIMDILKGEDKEGNAFARGEGVDAVAKALTSNGANKKANTYAFTLANEILASPGNHGEGVSLELGALSGADKIKADGFADIDKSWLDAIGKEIFANGAVRSDLNAEQEKMVQALRGVAGQIAENPQLASKLSAGDDARWSFLETVAKGTDIDLSSARGGALKVDHT